MAAESLTSSPAGGQIATTVLVVGEGAALFAAFCPSWFTVRSPFFHEQEAKEGNVSAIRQGEVAATIVTVAVSWAASAMVRSPLPLLGGLLVSALMVAGYEYSIAHPSQEKSAKYKHPIASAMSWRQVAP